MRKFLLTLFALLWISASAFAAPAHLDPQGFNGYPWGTDVNVICKDIDFKFEGGYDEITYYMSHKEIPSDIDPSSFLLSTYVFYQNRLVAGFLSSNISQSKKIEAQLIYKWGKPDYFSDIKAPIYSFPTTMVKFSEDMLGNWDCCVITFMSREYFDTQKNN